MIHKLLKSYIAGLISPWILFFCMRTYIIEDTTYSYWAAPIFCLMCFPLLCRLYLKIDEQTKSTVILFVFCSFLALCSNIIRQHTGLPIIFCLELWCVIRLFKQIKRKSERSKRIQKIGIFFLQSVLLFSLFYTEPVLHRIYDLAGGPLQIENVEQPWHAIWCGLGYFPNSYGFEWNDSAADAYAHSIDPNVVYCSEEYFGILKERVLEIARTDPLFVIQTCTQKFGIAFQMGWRKYGQICIVLGALWMLMTCVTKQRKAQRYVIPGMCLGGIVAISGTYQCIIGVPADRYNYSSYSGFTFIIALEALGIIGCVGEIIRRVKARLEVSHSDNCQDTIIHQVAELTSRKKDGSLILYILCPCYNEEEGLEEYTAVKLAELMERMISQHYISRLSRVCFINDGSTDHTAQIIRTLHEKNPLFSYINLSTNFGHQNALLCGLMETRHLADVTISIDCDLQQDPNAMFSFLDKYYEGYDIVYGVRYSRETDGKFKRMTADVYYSLLRMLSGMDIIRNHSDYRLMSRRAAEALSCYPEYNLYLRGLIPKMGFNSCIVYHAVDERKFGKSKYSLSKMLTLAADGITSFSIRPMAIIFGVGMFISVISMLLLSVYFVAYLCGRTISGWTSLILSVWLLGGMIMLSIGCIGEYMGKQYMEVKHRPRYIIEEFVNDTEWHRGESDEETFNQ